MFKITIATIATVLLSAGCYAQHTITGIVHDAKNRALINATVKLAQADRYTLCDDFGRFSFKNVPGGKDTLKVTYVGYENYAEAIDVSNDLSVSIDLTESSILTDAVVVSATRATDKTPTTFTTISKDKIQQQNFGQDLPLLLNWTPSVVTTSDAGNGVGYTGIRIRGSDPTRVNVTINGIPYNDSESLGTFWVDIPDIASSSQSIQIQRGVGSSTNGAGAFGGTINVQTNLRNDKPYAEVVNSFGSFNTRRHTFNFGTGLLNNHFVVDGRLSRIASDGFIDRAESDLQSYYFSAGYFHNHTMLKAVIFGGKERTYQSWYGVPESRLNNDVEAMAMTAMNEGWNDIQTQNLLSSNSRTFNPYLYHNQVDDYRQDHYQLHFSQKISEAFAASAALHYTPGKGFYEEYKYDADFEDYKIPSVTIGNTLVESSDLIRRRWLDNDFYGFTYSFNYDMNKWNVVLGGGWNRYDGGHYGEVIWAQVATVPNNFRYYFNNGDKRDFNSYLKINYQLTENLNAYADLQFRKISYKIKGFDNEMFDLNVDANFDFFNPKAGLTYVLSDASQLYASYGIGNREPARNDFTDFQNSNPRAEKMQNVEFGYRRTGTKHSINVNYYMMNYTDQLVLTGKVNDVGAFERTNAGKSYRTGIELQGALKLADRITWNANVTVSKNKIKEYKEVLVDYGDDFNSYELKERLHKNTDIAFSPNLIAGSSLTFNPVAGVDITLLSKYVGKQYLDNTSNAKRSIEAYIVNDLRLGYSWKPVFVSAINFSLLVNNILDETYESNGYTWGYLGGSTEYRENYYYPQAGRNFMVMVTVKF